MKAATRHTLLLVKIALKWYNIAFLMALEEKSHNRFLPKLTRNQFQFWMKIFFLDSRTHEMSLQVLT